MKKLNLKTVKHISIGLLAGIIITSTAPVIADSIQQKIEVILNNVNIAINGTTLANKNEAYTLSNGEKIPYSILYKGTTYLPMRVVAESVGKDVSWDGTTETAGINDKDVKNESEVKDTETNASLTYEDFKAMWEFEKEEIRNKIACTKYYLFKGNSIDDLSKISKELLKEYSISFYNESFTDTDYTYINLGLGTMEGNIKSPLIHVGNSNIITGELVTELTYICYVK